MVPEGSTTVERLLSVVAKATQQTAGGKGFKILKQANAPYTNIRVASIQPLASITLTAYKEQGVDLLADKELASTPIVAGSYLPAPIGNCITELNWTGGDILAYL